MKLSEYEVGLLQNMLEYLMLLSGGNGTCIYTGTTARTGLSVRSIAVREDTTEFTSLTCVSQDGTKPALAIGDFIVGSTTFNKGDVLLAPIGYIFTGFQLASGSITIAKA